MRALLASNPLRDIPASDAPKARQAPTGSSRPGPCCCMTLRPAPHPPRRHRHRRHTMKRFLRTHADQIKGVLSGFDRMRFRGTLRWLAYAQGMKKFLDHIHVFLKDFKAYVQHVTHQVRERTEKLAQDHGRPLIYLDGSPASQEERARDIAPRDVHDQG